MRRGMLDALGVVSLVAFPTFFGMAIVAPEALSVLGPKWGDAVIPFQILCLSFPFRALGVLFNPALFGTGRPRAAAENSAITLAGVAVALIVGVRWGIIGLCVGWLVGYVPVFCITACRALATLEIPIGQAVGVMRFPLAATLATSLGVLGVRFLLAGALPPLVSLTSLSLLGAGIYGGLMAAFRPRALRSFWTEALGR